ncbi:MAG: kelch repeat-containing protein [Planctomycetota bacterium]|jgi:hypothetical protein
MVLDTKRRIVACVLAIGLLAFGAGCALGSEEGIGGIGGGGGGGDEQVFGPIVFQAPEEGADVGEPIMLSASGPGIARVFFAVDFGQSVLDEEPPFELELDPLQLDKGQHFVEIVAQHLFGREERTTVNFRVIRLRPPLAEILAAMNALQPGEWYEIPETQMRDVDWAEGDPEKVGLRGDQSSIVIAISGGAYDTKRDRLVVWGGGGSALRNDLYVFDINTASWERLTDPSPLPPGGKDAAYQMTTHLDGAPVSRHSFDVLEYIPDPVDRLYLGGGNTGLSGSISDPLTYLFDFETNTWEHGPLLPVSTLGGFSGLTPAGRLWQHGAGSNSALLMEVDLATGLVTNHVPFDNWLGNEANAVYDPARNQLVAVGRDATRIWDLDDPDQDSFILATTGDTLMESGTAPGLVYHAGTDRVIAWHGGKDIYALDLDTAVWTRVAGQGDVDPGPGTERGVYSRWCYIPSKDLFIVVADVDRNVFVYRLAAIP